MNQFKSLRARFNSTINLKLLFLSFFILLMLFFTLKSKSSLQQSLSSYQESTITAPNSSISVSRVTAIEENVEEEEEEDEKVERKSSVCNKIPPSLADAIIRYATTNSTPQQTMDEISVTARVLAEKSPCNFLVFGLGRDSLMWAALNHGGRTVFLEEDKAWIDEVRRQIPTLESHHVTYTTKVSEAHELLKLRQEPECRAVVDNVKASMCPLTLKQLPDFVYEVEWDLIMVDAPTGYYPQAPGRMGAIYTAGMVARRRSAGETHLFVHDVNRFAEDQFSKAFWCEAYMKEQVGLLRHFVVPSQRNINGNVNIPFCPE